MSEDAVDPELVEVINRRMDVLSALTTTREKRDLVEELELSRSTVNRAVRQLESLGLVTRRGGYRRTVAGRLVHQVYGGFVDELAQVVRMEGLLTGMPQDHPMDLAMVRDATAHRASAAAPTAALERSAEIVRSAERLKTLTPRLSRPDLFDVVREEVDDGLALEMVLSRKLLEHLREHRPEWLSAVGAAPEAELYVRAELTPNLGAARLPEGRRAAVRVYDTAGEFRGLVENDSLEAYTWAESVFADVRADAEPLDG